VAKATASFRDIDKAIAAGYTIELADKDGITCIDDPAGGMGIHYVNGDLVSDAVASATHPDALVYEPDGKGRLKLVALEYVVFESAWQEAHPGTEKVPTLFGREFERLAGPGEAAPNRYGLPASTNSTSGCGRPTRADSSRTGTRGSTARREGVRETSCVGALELGLVGPG
jgi:hypothetical protein